MSQSVADQFSPVVEESKRILESSDSFFAPPGVDGAGR
jgi:hypothetical protein